MFIGIRGIFMRNACCATALVVAFTSGAVGDDSRIAEVELPRNQAARPERIRDDELLPNVIKLHNKIYSGGQPHGAEAFKALREMGVKTIISVDGAKPDLKTAHEYGLRYVHLPHGYNGISRERAEELARAVHHLPGPIYIHCHHGKHRSPAAAAVACVGAGLLSPDLSLTVLKTAGTSESYEGLYQAAEGARRLELVVLNGFVDEFPEIVALPPLAEAMVELEHTHDNLKAIAKAGWKPTPEHPDIDPAHEALLLREHYAELLRTDDARQAPESFREFLADSEAAALELEEALRAPMNGREADLVASNRAFEMVTKNCAACHKEHRDVPLVEKRLM